MICISLNRFANISCEQEAKNVISNIHFFIPSSSFLCVRVRVCAILSTFVVYSPRICVKSMTIDWGCESVGIHKFFSSVILSHSKSRSSSVAHSAYTATAAHRQIKSNKQFLHSALSFEFDLVVIHPILCIWWFHLSIQPFHSLALALPSCFYHTIWYVIGWK